VDASEESTLGGAGFPQSDGATTPMPCVGWFGKIPSVGDFVTRRLPPSFVRPWDQWLQTGMLESRRHIGDQWVDVYLTFPVWRFLLPLGVLGPTAWTGVLMPSVDRVGRYFPLTLAAPLNRSDFDGLGLDDLEALLKGMEEAGLAALDGEPIDPFDLRIRSLRHAPVRAVGALPPLTRLEDEDQVGHWPLAQGLDVALRQQAAQHLLSFLGRRSLWWLPGVEQSGGTIRLDRWPMAFDAFQTLILQD
jgi:type VI secretion system protein ImpM